MFRVVRRALSGGFFLADQPVSLRGFMARLAQNLRAKPGRAP